MGNALKAALQSSRFMSRKGTQYTEVKPKASTKNKPLPVSNLQIENPICRQNLKDLYVRIEQQSYRRDFSFFALFRSRARDNLIQLHMHYIFVCRYVRCLVTPFVVSSELGYT